MLSFELLYGDIDSLDVSNLDEEFIKSRLGDSAFSSNKDPGTTVYFEQKSLFVK